MFALRFSNKNSTLNQIFNFLPQKHCSIYEAQNHIDDYKFLPQNTQTSNIHATIMFVQIYGFKNKFYENPQIFYGNNNYQIALDKYLLNISTKFVNSTQLTVNEILH